MTLRSFLPKQPISISFLKYLPCIEPCARHCGNVAPKFRELIRHRPRLKRGWELRKKE